MKRIAKLIFVFLFILTVFGCTQNSLTGKEEVAGGGTFVSLDSNIDLNAARSIAQMKLDELVSDGSCNWNEQSVITDHYPIYLPEQENPSYYEFKVETDGNDAGFILVNIDKTDIVVPEIRLEGITVFEEYSEAITRCGDFRVVRINMIESYAESKGINRNDGKREIIASLGIVNDLVTNIDQDINAIIYEYRETAGDYITENGCIITYDPDTISAYYSSLEISRSAEKLLKNKKTQLNTRYKLSNGYATPQWHQPVYNDRAIGCGASAWAILLGFWHQHRNKDLFMINGNRLNLYDQEECEKYEITLDDIIYFIYRIEPSIFEDLILSKLQVDSANYILGLYKKVLYSDGYFYGIYNSLTTEDVYKIYNLLNSCGYYSEEQISNRIYSTMVEIYDDIKSEPYAFDDHSTLTWPLDMMKGYQFAVDRGYTSSSCTWKAGYSSYDQNLLYNEVANNKPVIILVCSKTGTSVTKGIADHYAVVEGVQIDYYNSTSAYAQSTGFLINYGNSGKYGWAYNAVKNYDVYDAYIVNIK